MKRDFFFRIEDILESIDKIEQYTKGKTQEEFYENNLLQDAVVRRLEVIGEAAKHIPTTIKNKNAQIPWKQMSGLRDIAIHDYSSLEYLRIWNTLKKDLPSTKVMIEQLKKEMEDITQ